MMRSSSLLVSFVNCLYSGDLGERLHQFCLLAGLYAVVNLNIIVHVAALTRPLSISNFVLYFFLCGDVPVPLLLF